MSRRARVGWILSAVLLILNGALGLFNGIHELDDTLTAFQRAVSTCVLLYGVLAAAAAVALLKRHPASVWLAATWGVLVTFVASTAALAYAPNATMIGAVSGGLGTALIAAAVVWSARVSSASTR